MISAEFPTYRCITPAVLLHQYLWKHSHTNPEPALAFLFSFLSSQLRYGDSLLCQSAPVFLFCLSWELQYVDPYSAACSVESDWSFYRFPNRFFFFLNTKAIVDNSSTSFHDFFLHHVQVSIFLDSSERPEVIITFFLPFFLMWHSAAGAWLNVK